VWQKAHAFILAVYRVSAAFPKSEKFGLISQLRRSASSVPTNIVEGFNCLGMGKKVRGDRPHGRPTTCWFWINRRLRTHLFL